jgi:hypothetical protein
MCKNVKTKIYKTIILSVILYGCETTPLTLRDEDKLKVFGSRVPKKIFELKRNEITGGWRKLHNMGFIICACRQ